MHGNWALFAIDEGPRNTLNPLSYFDNFFWIDHHAISNEIINAKALVSILNEFKLSGIVVGTSRSQFGLKLESSLRVAATSCNIPVVIIEDYPGNYQHIDGSITALLVIENLSYFSKDLKYLNIIEGSLLRYDFLRSRLHEIRHYSERDKNHSSQQSVIWIGQPETDACHYTLSRLVPILNDLNVRFYFKAHSRDVGYRENAYDLLLNQLKDGFVDLTNSTMESCHRYAPNLALTHFSSGVIDFGFYGTMMAMLLLPEAGGLVYRRIYGTDPPIGQFEAKGIEPILGEKHIASSLISLLYEKSVNLRLKKNFDKYYRVNKLQTKNVVHSIEKILK